MLRSTKNLHGNRGSIIIPWHASDIFSLLSSKFPSAFLKIEALEKMVGPFVRTEVQFKHSTQVIAKVRANLRGTICSGKIFEANY